MNRFGRWTERSCYYLFAETPDALRAGRRSVRLARPEPVAFPVPGQLGHLHQSHLPGRAHPERHIGEAHPEGPERGLPAQVRLQQLGQLPTALAPAVGRRRCPRCRRRRLRSLRRWRLRRGRERRGHRRRRPAAAHQTVPAAHRVHIDRVRLGQGAQRTAHLSVRPRPRAAHVAAPALRVASTRRFRRFDISRGTNRRYPFFIPLNPSIKLLSFLIWPREHGRDSEGSNSVFGEELVCNFGQISAKFFTSETFLEGFLKSERPEWVFFFFFNLNSSLEIFADRQNMSFSLFQSRQRRTYVFGAPLHSTEIKFYVLKMLFLISTYFKIY